MDQFITLLDYLLLPFYLVFVYMIAYNFRNKKYPPGHPWHPYFMPAFTVKIIGSIFIGLIYQYYYGGGDTANYFHEAEIINKAFNESPDKWFNLLLHIPHWYDGAYTEYTSQLYWYDAPTEYTVCAIAAFLSFFTFTTFLPTSVLFGSLAFTGIWALFRTFATQYPLYTKYIAWCVLFIPSTVMWGSGIFKDTICMASLGWLTYGAFRLLVNRDFKVGNIIAVLVSFYLIATIKIYILLAFLPALSLWILFTYSHKIGSPVGRFLVKFLVIGIAAGGFLYFSQKFASTLGKYSLDKVAKTSQVTQQFVASMGGDSGSAYDLGGSDDASLGGMLKKFPLAVNVTLFRPYLWEAKKPIVMVNALEAMLFFWVTIKVLFKVGLRKTWQTIVKDPTIQFCLIFTVIFAFAVGLSSGTFGSLSRYRIPCLPFYGIALVLIYYKNRPLENNIIAFRWE